MKLKSYIGLCIACAAIAVMATVAHAETYSVGVLQSDGGHVDDTEQDDQVDVPVVVTPDAAEESASVNGYIMTFTYNPNLATPVKTDDADSPYATVGSGEFTQANGIIVSADQEISANEHRLIVAWAAASPVVVEKKQEGEQQGAVMADVQFTVNEKTENIPIDVSVAQLANDGEGLADADTDFTVQNGVIDLVEDAFLLGDINADGSVTSKDAALAAQYELSRITLTSDELNRGEVNGDGLVTSKDAALIAQYELSRITEFPRKN